MIYKRLSLLQHTSQLIIVSNVIVATPTLTATIAVLGKSLSFPKFCSSILEPNLKLRIVSFFEQILFHFDFLKRKYSAKFYCWQMQYHKIGWIFKSRITNNSMLSFAALNIYKILNIKASNKICVILLNTRCATEYNMILKIMILSELLYF